MTASPAPNASWPPLPAGADLPPEWCKNPEERAAAIFRSHDIDITMGGEPTYVAEQHDAPEWNYTALGTDKLQRARQMAQWMQEQFFPNSAAFLTPGKIYPGELNPRWSIKLLIDRSPLQNPHATSAELPSPEAIKSALTRALGIKNSWQKWRDRQNRDNCVWVLPLDHQEHWVSDRWRLWQPTLLPAEGAAGLRLPLAKLPKNALKRALTLEHCQGRVTLFIPPLREEPFCELLGLLRSVLGTLQHPKLFWAGYVPTIERENFTILGFTADPGVLEINLPPCRSWEEYRRWLILLEEAAGKAGLQTHKKPGVIYPSEGTGGGHHLLFGGPDLARNPFFSRPSWIASILAYWHQHPSLAYLFSGNYVGPGSQAPRPDESGHAPEDFALACQALESRSPIPSPQEIADTLHHLMTDSSGNPHRSEISFDKFWNAHSPTGRQGLLEFRAIDTFPNRSWSEAVILLWQCVVAHCLEMPRVAQPFERAALHDRYMLPVFLWKDFTSVLSDLQKVELHFPEAVYREILDWRFPIMLDFREGEARLQIRRALDPWPVLHDPSLDGNATSRYVDTSVRRIEVAANADFLNRYRLFLNHRELSLEHTTEGGVTGLRFRQTRFSPSLHPLLAECPFLNLEIISAGNRFCYRLSAAMDQFRPADFSTTSGQQRPIQATAPFTKDLRF